MGAVCHFKMLMDKQAAGTVKDIQPKANWSWKRTQSEKVFQRWTQHWEKRTPRCGGVTNKSILYLRRTFHLPCFFPTPWTSSAIHCQNYSCFHLSLSKENVPLLGHTKLSQGKLGCSLPCWSSVTHWTQSSGNWGVQQWSEENPKLNTWFTNCFSM